MRDEVHRDGIVYGRHAPEKWGAARRMRREMTRAEALLWERLRDKRLGGLPFLRQQIIDGLIVDFYCHQAGLVVEADGPIHEKHREHDEDRDAVLKRRGLLVLRFTNEAIESDTDAVLREILAAAIPRVDLLKKGC